MIIKRTLRRRKKLLVLLVLLNPLPATSTSPNYKLNILLRLSVLTSLIKCEDICLPFEAAVVELSVRAW